MTTPPPWARVAFLGAVYGLAIAAAPFSWRAHPLAFKAATTLPFLLAPLLSAFAWATVAPARPVDGPARRVAALLLVSACVDVSAAGALWWGSPWTWAAPLSWVTWIACGIAVAREAWPQKRDPR